MSTRQVSRGSLERGRGWPVAATGRPMTGRAVLGEELLTPRNRHGIERRELDGKDALVDRIDRGDNLRREPSLQQKHHSENDGHRSQTGGFLAKGWRPAKEREGHARNPSDQQ